MEKTVELLMKNASLLDVELVAGVLKQEGIPHFIKEKGPGGIYCGGAIMGADLYVPGECLETAMDIAEDVLFTQPDTRAQGNMTQRAARPFQSVKKTQG